MVQQWLQMAGWSLDGETEKEREQWVQTLAVPEPAAMVFHRANVYFWRGKALHLDSANAL